MEVLDEQGRLFGRVNIVDALVVLFAVAVIVAGAALVFGDSPTPAPEPAPEEATLHVTLVTTGDPATALEPGEVRLDNASANVSDIHRTPGPRTYLRVALNGTETDEGFRFEGNNVRLGDSYTVMDNTTRTGGRVIERDVASDFETQTTTVTVETTLRTPIAEAVQRGDEQRVGDASVLTVASTETTQVNDTHTDLEAKLELETRLVEDVPYYGGRPVRLGREVAIQTDDYEFVAEIVSRE